MPLLLMRRLLMLLRLLSAAVGAESSVSGRLGRGNDKKRVSGSKEKKFQGSELLRFDRL